MLRKIVLLCASCVIILASVTVAYAGYGPAVTVGNGSYILSQLRDHTGNIVADVSPSAASYTYKVTVSYDSLSDICVTANGYGLTCSLYYNSFQGVYVVRVHDGLTVEQIFDFTSTYGVLANSDGYIYTAKKDSSPSEAISTSIFESLECIHNHIINIQNRCGDFYVLLSNINDILGERLVRIQLGIESVGTKLSNINTNLMSVIVALNDEEESPLLLKLDEIKAAISNITISADDLTINAYDDTSLLSKLLSIDKHLANIENNGSDSLYMLESGGGEVPITIFDYITMRIVPSLVNLENYTASIQNSLGSSQLTISTSVFRMASMVSSIHSKMDSLLTAIENITVTADNLTVTAYDDTNMIAAVNSVETALSNLSFSGEVNTDLTPVITSVDAVGLNIENLNANFNANIGSLLDKLDIVIEGTSESVENRINVTIDASNDAYNVFYITGEDGETQSVTEFTGDLTKASGRLLSLLYRLVFADTLSGVDGDLDGFEDFFTSQGDDTSTQSMESPYEEENVWLAS